MIQVNDPLSVENVKRASAWVRDRASQDTLIAHVADDLCAMLDAFAALQAEQGQEPYNLDFDDQLDRLICAYGSASHECGDHRGDVESYAPLLTQAVVAEHRIKALVDKHIRSIGKPTPPAEQWVSVKERLPEVEPGSYELVIVTCVRAHDGKRYVFQAAYLNDMELENSDGLFKSTGFFDECASDEYDKEFQPFGNGDVIVAWMPRPAPFIDSTDAGGKTA